MRIGVGLSIPELATRGGRFSPASLFTSGVAGAWYDPSDYSTLFQDSAGTTPVTAVEQPVGLMLDKSQGLVLGSELVTNGDFATNLSGWTVLAGTATWQSGAALLGDAGVITNFQQIPAGLSTSKRYIVAFNYSVTAGNLSFWFGSGGGGLLAGVTGSGTYRAVVSPVTGLDLYFRVTAGGSVTIDNISVKEIPGNHASQATAASRPVLRARYNSLLYSETFSNAVWQSASSGTAAAGVKTPNFGTAPDGTQTACRIQLDVSAGSTGNQSQIYQNYACAVGNLTYQCYVKTNDGSTKTICPFTATGAVLTVTGTWQLFTFTRSSGAASDNFQFILIKGTTSDTADLLVWHPQSNPGSSAGTYQRIAAATDYATAGFLPYLALDGTDDSFGTNSIDFTATDKMFVCTGLTKLSDAVAGIVAELSANWNSNAGSFLFTAPSANAPTNDIAFASRGNAVVNANQQASTAVAAPTTKVISALNDIAASTTVLRSNGADVNTATGSKGTGNFGNYPLYIGRRANTSVPFNGRIYQLIVCGKTLSASELASTEAYVATKTGVTI